MVLFDSNLGKVRDVEVVKGVSKETMYVDRMTETHLNALGYFKVEFKPKPNSRYYVFSESKSIVNGKFVVDYDTVEKPLDEVVKLMLFDLKQAHDKYSVRPRVWVESLGYFVDGSRHDKENFEVGRDLALPQIKDADNDWHDATLDDYEAILFAIKVNGVMLWDRKNQIESEIKALPDVTACEAYEKHPVPVMVDVLDPVTLEPTGQQVEDIQYKNKVKEWF